MPLHFRLDGRLLLGVVSSERIMNSRKLIATEVMFVRYIEDLLCPLLGYDQKQLMLFLLMKRVTHNPNTRLLAIADAKL
jgi:hypothetical protein